MVDWVSRLGQVLLQLEENRASTNPGRSELEMRLMLRAMSSAEIIALAERLVEENVEIALSEKFFLIALWKRYAAIDPEAAHRNGLLLETRFMLTSVAGIGSKAFALADPYGALASFIEQERENVGVSAIGVALKELVKSDPQGAIAILDEHRDEDWYARARSSLFGNWWRVDKDAALEWLLGRMRDDPESVPSAMYELAGADPAGALDMALGMEPNAQMRKSVSSIIVWRLYNHNREAALGALARLPDEWHSRHLAEDFGSNRVTKTPVAELDAMAEMFPIGEIRNEFWRAALARRAAEAEFDEAFALLEKLPAGEARGDGAAGIVGHWAKLNPARVSEWLGAPEPSIERDRAVHRFAETIAPLDPDSAHLWAESIDDEETRARAIEDLIEP